MNADEPSHGTARSRPESAPSAWPRHIAVIMDGNGRWARERDLPRIAGHQQGAESVRRVVEQCRALEIEALTLFSFSSENWKRPKDEVDALMTLCCEHLVNERKMMIENGIRLLWIGRKDPLPAKVVDELRRTEDATAHCRGLDLVLAINYGARAEIVDAVRSLANDAKAGRLLPEDITESLFSSRLDTAGLPDPDLLIRTAGEQRLSNYLLWQISYAEIHVTDDFWPEFDEDALNRAIDDFAARKRRFGGIDTPVDESTDSAN